MWHFNYGPFYILTVLTVSIPGYFHYDVNYNMQSFLYVNLRKRELSYWNMMLFGYFYVWCYLYDAVIYIMMLSFTLWCYYFYVWCYLYHVIYIMMLFIWWCYLYDVNLYVWCCHDEDKGFTLLFIYLKKRVFLYLIIEKGFISLFNY
jgi:hypothetical protein